MKRFFFLLFITFSLGFSSFAQTQVNLFYNKSWQITEKEKAYYFRNCLINAGEYSTFIGPFKDFTVDGKILTSGNYNGKGEKAGEFIFYFENGLIEARGNFKNNSRNGLWEYWYPDGKKKYEIIFNNSDFEIRNYWNLNGEHKVIEGNGLFEEYIQDPPLMISGYVLNGKRDGKWTCYFRDNRWVNTGKQDSVFYNEYYKEGKFKRVVIHTKLVGNIYSKHETGNILQVPKKFATTEGFGYDYKLFGIDNHQALTEFVFTGKEPRYTANPEFFSDNLPEIQNILRHRLENPDNYKDILLVVEATLLENGTLSNFKFRNEPEIRLKKNVISVLSKIDGLIPQKEAGIPIQSKIIIPVQQEGILKVNKKG